MLFFHILYKAITTERYWELWNKQIHRECYKSGLMHNTDLDPLYDSAIQLLTAHWQLTAQKSLWYKNIIYYLFHFISFFQV